MICRRAYNASFAAKKKLDFGRQTLDHLTRKCVVVRGQDKRSAIHEHRVHDIKSSKDITCSHPWRATALIIWQTQEDIRGDSVIAVDGEFQQSLESSHRSPLAQEFDRPKMIRFMCIREIIGNNFAERENTHDLHANVLARPCPGLEPLLGEAEFLELGISVIVCSKRRFPYALPASGVLHFPGKAFRPADKVIKKALGLYHDFVPRGSSLGLNLGLNLSQFCKANRMISVLET